MCKATGTAITSCPVALQNALDELGKFNLPIRVTELNLLGQRSKYYTTDRQANLSPEEKQAKATAPKRYFRISFAHPAVSGILLWGCFLEGANWITQSSLYKRDWTMQPQREVLDVGRSSYLIGRRGFSQAP